MVPKSSALIIAVMLSGCAGAYATRDSSAAPSEPRAKPVGAACDAEPVQQHVGKEATQEVGKIVLDQSGARALRWGPPNSAWTMDYSEQRVNIRYDENMTITAITCG